MAAKARHHIVQLVTAVRRIDQIGVQHQIIAHASQVKTLRFQRTRQRLEIMHGLGQCRLFQRGAHLRVGDCNAQGKTRIRRQADPDLRWDGCFLSLHRMDSIEQRHGLRCGFDFFGCFVAAGFHACCIAGERQSMLTGQSKQSVNLCLRGIENVLRHRLRLGCARSPVVRRQVLSAAR